MQKLIIHIDKIYVITKSNDDITYFLRFIDSLWYVFSSVTTIGFGDVIAGLPNGKEVDHHTNFYWVIFIGNKFLITESIKILETLLIS